MGKIERENMMMQERGTWVGGAMHGQAEGLDSRISCTIGRVSRVSRHQDHQQLYLRRGEGRVHAGRYTAMVREFQEVLFSIPLIF